MPNLTRRGPNATTPARMPALPAAPYNLDPELRQWLEGVREWLEVRLGSRGDFFERAVTHRELRDQLAALERSLSTTGTVTIPDEILAPLRAQLRGLSLNLQFAENRWLTSSVVGSTATQNITNQLRDIAVQDVPYFARDMLPSATGGCSALTVVEFSAAGPNFHALLFDPTTDESADFHAMLPDAWAGKQFRLLIYWGHGSGATTFNVKWELQANSTSDDEPLILDFVGGVFVEDTGGTAGDLYIGAVSEPIPIASDKNANGDMVSMRITRRNTGVSGNLDVDAALLAVRFVLADEVFPGVPTDPYWANVALLLHFDGADGSTTIEDSSQYARTGTGGTNIKLSTTRSKFGASSLKITQRDTGGVVFGSSSDFGIATDDPYTLECWVYSVTTNNSTSTPDLINWDRAATFRDRVVLYATAPGVYGDTEAFGDQMTPHNISANTWVHLAYVFDGTNVNFYVDGTSVASWARSGTGQASGTFYIGGRNGGGTETIEVYMDEVRVTLGVARYTATFTPPTEAFPNG